MSKHPVCGIKNELVELWDERDIPGFVDRATAEGVARLPTLDRYTFQLSTILFQITDFWKYDHSSQIYRPLGLTSSGVHLMWIVWLSDSIDASGIAKLMGASRPSVSGLTNTLIREGLLKKTPSPDDGRSALFSLTAAGHDRLESALKQSSDSGLKKFSCLSKDEATQLLNLLYKLSNGMVKTSSLRPIENR